MSIIVVDRRPTARFVTLLLARYAAAAAGAGLVALAVAVSARYPLLVLSFCGGAATGGVIGFLVSRATRGGHHPTSFRRHGAV